jgi:hypothetical protein
MIAEAKEARRLQRAEIRARPSKTVDDHKSKRLTLATEFSESSNLIPNIEMLSLNSAISQAPGTEEFVNQMHEAGETIIEAEMIKLSHATVAAKPSTTLQLHGVDCHEQDADTLYRHKLRHPASSEEEWSELTTRSDSSWADKETADRTEPLLQWKLIRQRHAPSSPNSWATCLKSTLSPPVPPIFEFQRATVPQSFHNSVHGSGCNLYSFTRRASSISSLLARVRSSVRPRFRSTSMMYDVEKGEEDPDPIQYCVQESSTYQASPDNMYRLLRFLLEKQDQILRLREELDLMDMSLFNISRNNLLAQELDLELVRRRCMLVMKIAREKEEFSNARKECRRFATGYAQVQVTTNRPSFTSQQLLVVAKLL